MKKIIMIGLIVSLILINGCNYLDKQQKETDCQLEQAKELCEHYGYSFIQVTMGGTVSCETEWHERIDYDIKWNCK